MKTSWIETQKLEAFLLDEAGEETPVLEARLILDAALQENLQWQKNTYSVIQAYGRMQLKADLEKIHQTLFQNNTFREKILKLFTKP